MKFFSISSWISEINLFFSNISVTLLKIFYSKTSRVLLIYFFIVLIYFVSCFFQSDLSSLAIFLKVWMGYSLKFSSKLLNYLTLYGAVGNKSSNKVMTHFAHCYLLCEYICWFCKHSGKNILFCGLKQKGLKQIWKFLYSISEIYFSSSFIIFLSQDVQIIKFKNFS